MKSGELSLAVEIPPEFSQKLHKGEQVEIGAWIDGAMPSRAETIQGYVTGIHLKWLLQQASQASQVQSTVVLMLSHAICITQMFAAWWPLYLR